MKMHPGIVSPAAPFIYASLSIRSLNLFIIAMLSAQILVLGVSKDFYALLNVFFAASAVCFADILVSLQTAGKIKFHLASLATGIIIGFFMPVNIGFVFVFFVSFTGFLLSKLIFGGTGSNWINPVAFTVCITYISKTRFFPESFSDINGLKAAGSLFAVLQMNDFPCIKADSSVTSILNSFFLHGAGVTLPEGYISLFVNSASKVPAFRYNLITLISSAILFGVKAIDRIIPLVFILTYGILVWVFAQVPVTGVFFSGDILAALLTGGVLFTAVFVLTESASAPASLIGKAAAGCLTGIFAFLICGPGTSPAGILFSVLLMNVFTPVIKIAEEDLQNKKRKQYE